MARKFGSEPWRSWKRGRQPPVQTHRTKKNERNWWKRAILHQLIWTIYINIPWVWPPPCNSDHQDYYIFNRESQPKPSFTTVTVRGPYPKYTIVMSHGQLAFICFNWCRTWCRTGGFFSDCQTWNHRENAGTLRMVP